MEEVTGYAVSQVICIVNQCQSAAQSHGSPDSTAYTSALRVTVYFYPVSSIFKSVSSQVPFLKNNFQVVFKLLKFDR